MHNADPSHILYQTCIKFFMIHLHNLHSSTKQPQYVVWCLHNAKCILSIICPIPRHSSQPAAHVLAKSSLFQSALPKYLKKKELLSLVDVRLSHDTNNHDTKCYIYSHKLHMLIWSESTHLQTNDNSVKFNAKCNQPITLQYDWMDSDQNHLWSICDRK